MNALVPIAVCLTFPMLRNSSFWTALGLLVHTVVLAGAANPDWLIDPSPYRARVQVAPDRPELVLDNGLLRRVIRLEPNAATVSLENRISGESLIRGVKPEAVGNPTTPSSGPNGRGNSKRGPRRFALWAMRLESLRNAWRGNACVIMRRGSNGRRGE